MVLQKPIDDRALRILQKREQASQERIEQETLREAEESLQETNNSDKEKKEDSRKPKKIKIEGLQSDNIIANVYHFLSQEYKYLRLLNDNDPQLRPLGAITKRTSNATGVARADVRAVVKEERAKRSARRKLERRKQKLEQILIQKGQAMQK